MAAKIIQTAMGMAGALGFAMLFGIHDKKLWYIALGSGLGWAAYLVCVAAGGSTFISLLAASLLIGGFSEILARIVKAPVILLLVPMLIPEIPGGDLYYTMLRLVEGNTAGFVSSAKLVLIEAGAIALGILLASYAAGLAGNIRKQIRC